MNGISMTAVARVADSVVLKPAGKAGLLGLMIICAALVVGMGGYAEAARVTATPASVPPVLDGRLDDACWQTAQPIGQFVIHGNQGPAKYATTAYICYDRTNIYVGIRCSDPEPENIVTGVLKHDDTAIFSHDVIEIMLSSTPSSGNYVHFAVNPSGSTFDTYHTQTGGAEDSRWDGVWQAAAVVDAQGWTAEVALPFAGLDVTGGTGNTWAVNICRQKPKPRELSSMLPDGTFNSLDRHAVLTGLQVDFRRFNFRLSDPLVSFRMIDGKPHAVMEFRATNETGRSQQVAVKYQVSGRAIPDQTIRMDSGKTVTLGEFPIALEETIAGKPGHYLVTGKPDIRQVTLRDAAGGDLLAVATPRPPRTCSVLDIRVENPLTPERIVSRPKALAVEVDLPLVTKVAGDSHLVVTIEDQSGKRAARQSLRTPKTHNRILFPTQDLPWGAYTIRACWVHGKTTVEDTRSYSLMPDGRERIRPLNSLVFELLNAGGPDRQVEREMAFMNPRDGWCLFSLDAPEGTRLLLDDDSAPILTVRGTDTPSETMRLLPAGRRRLRVEGEADVKQVIVRAIPELIYARLAYFPAFADSGPFDWEFLSKDVLPNCTTILGPPRGEVTQKWHEQGRRLVNEGPGPPNMPNRDSATADDYYSAWTRNAGLSDPTYSGLFVDEFGGSDYPVVDPVIGAMRKVAANPEYRGKTVTPWCYFSPGKRSGFDHGSAAATLMVETAIRAGWPVSYEAYLIEAPDLPSAREEIDSRLVETVGYWNRAIPDAVQHMVLTLNYSREFNVDPSADFMVYLDMQLQKIAQSPDFFGLYGIMAYISTYADRDWVSWAGKLYRHYAIEGNTELLGKDPYKLKHVVNPDFDEGLKGWEVQPAEADSMRALSVPGWGDFQSRHTKLFAPQWAHRGDNVLLARRSASRPNVFTQEITGLEPGRLYSVKILTGDYSALSTGASKKEPNVVSVHIENADMLSGPHNSSVSLFRNKQSSAFPAFTAESPYWFSHHWQVFRARASTATLVVSDWKSGTEPGGPVGQEIAFNFIEVQPYLE